MFDENYLCSTDAGEFRIDFDDDMEGEAWISTSQEWKCLRPAVQASNDQSRISGPALSHLDERPAATATASLNTATRPASNPVHTTDAPAWTPSGTCEQALESNDVSCIVQVEFDQLYQSVVGADGRGFEPQAKTRSSFQQLYDAVVQSVG